MVRPLGTLAIKRSWRLDAPMLAMILNAVHDRHKGRVFVVEVGSGSGEGGLGLLDRFRDDGWSGLLIEPHPAQFTALETLHTESDRVAVLNLGISDIAANLPLHFLKPEALERNPKLARHRASIVRDRILVRGATADDLDSVEVPFIRLDAVLHELGIKAAQLLVVNAGGHEEQVLRSFDLAAVRPSAALVRAEPGTPSNDALVDVLEAAGLSVFRIGRWLAGLAPGLTVPLDELFTFFNRGIGQTEVEE
ncbi:FkbM family methyltransferase [Tabrizicola aquatica]|uniref:FkbM family methyltransferase n=1 Tax=Tabrizicola aquatica TaxID=909926 RepID=UPI0011AF8186|nr:FkbM family methyltransferase [Tabrizicola aquatica]